MLSKIIEAENKFNNLLPARQLKHNLPAGLLSAAIAWSDAIWNEAVESGPVLLTDEILAHGKNLAAHPVFICGVHRSGTTLIRNLLDGHPDLVVLPSEGTYFTNLEIKIKSVPETGRMAFLGKEWLRRLANPTNQPPYWLLGRSSVDGSRYVDFARYFMAWWNVLKQKEDTQWPHTAVVLAYASVTGNITAKLWVDKTPVNERFIERIWREMPEAKIIHIVRDPFATITSRKVMEPAITMRNALRDLKLSFNTAITYASDPRFMLLHYEALCDEPAGTMKRLTSFLDIPMSSVLNQATVGGIPAQANSSFDSNNAEAGQVLKAQKQVSPKILNAAEQQLIISYVGNQAARLGYKVGKIGFLRRYYLIFKYRLL